MSEAKNLFRVFQVAGREFRIYYEYYEQMEKSYPEFPDFVSRPEYTEDGYAFAHYVQEGCKDGSCKDGTPGIPENCGMCSYFRWEKPDIPIGVCLNETLKLTGIQNTEEDQT